MLRLQLHFIQAYLFTCSSDKGQELRKMFWPREYLYEHVHLYSAHVSLIIIRLSAKSGELVALLHFLIMNTELMDKLLVSAWKR